MLTAILMALLTVQTVSGQQRNDTRPWYVAYADAKRQIQQKSWTGAVADIETAIRRGAPKPARRVLLYGLVYGEFNPDYYLGVAYLNLNRYRDADRAFERVRQAQLITPRDSLYTEFMRQATMARKLDSQVAAGAPQPSTPLPPDTHAPPTTGPISPVPAPPQPSTTPSAPVISPPPTTSSPPDGMPVFPWPPPRYSASSTISRGWIATDAGATLASAARRLEAAFDAAGYAERTYYWIPGGFALVSRIEQIQPDAAPVKSARWVVNTPKMRNGLIDYVRALFNAPPGFYRVIVFTVTDQDFAARSRPPTSSEASTWVSAGSLRLPPTIGSLSYSEGHYTTALIYEFERRPDQPEARMRTPSDSPGRVHLEKAGLWQALARR